MNLNERPHGDVDHARAASHYTGSGWSAAPMAFARAMRDAFLHARARVEEWWEATANSHVLRVADSVAHCLPCTRVRPGPQGTGRVRRWRGTRKRGRRGGVMHKKQPKIHFWGTHTPFGGERDPMLIGMDAVLLEECAPLHGGLDEWARLLRNAQNHEHNHHKYTKYIASRIVHTLLRTSVRPHRCGTAGRVWAGWRGALLASLRGLQKAAKHTNTQILITAFITPGLANKTSPPLQT